MESLPSVERQTEHLKHEGNGHSVDVHVNSGPVSGIMASSELKKLTLIHFNDVYNIEPREKDPVGGAARFTSQVKKYADEHPLVVFSGDAFNPSLLSTITMGKQMVPILRAVGVAVAAVGNHDLDFGVENLTTLTTECNFPWLMANVLDKKTGQPLGGVQRSVLLDWHGVKVGVVGLVEREWLATLSQVDPEAVDYLDFVEEGRRLAQELKAQGAELLVALTHMRLPNDQRLVAEVPEFHIVAGGHDHHYEVALAEPHGTLLLKSGTDFRELTKVTVVLGQGAERPQMTWERVYITSDIPEDPEVKAVVDEYMELMGARMDDVLAETATELEGRFSMVRTRETTLGNFVTDAWRADSGVDAVLLNSGSLRSDQLHPPGPITMRDMVSILPMMDETVVLECPGTVVLEALENGVSQYPKLEGRFLQVSGVRFEFDPRQAPGARVVPGSVTIGGKPLRMDRLYKVATKAYLAEGKDGFDCFARCKVLVDAEDGILLPTMMRNHFRKLCVINALGKGDDATKVAQRWLARRRTSTSTSNLAASTNSANSTSANNLAAASNGASSLPADSTLPAPAGLATAAWTDGQEAAGQPEPLSSLCERNPLTGRYGIAPRLEGRIVNICEAQA